MKKLLFRKLSEQKHQESMNSGSASENTALYLCISCLIIGCSLSIHSAWRWPLVGDASLIRYVVFLIHSGMAPYSQIVDINLPGSYFIEYCAMKFFGWGAHGLRIYDGFLCTLLVALSYLAGNNSKRERLFCLAGGLLFVLVHLQDGLEQAGQRDFSMAIILLGGLVLLIRTRRLALTSLFLFETLIGLSLTIKPTLLPMVLLPLLFYKTAPDKSFKRMLLFCSVGVAGLAIPVALMFLWLNSYNSVHAFYDVVRSIDVLHGTLGRKSLWFRLQHCMSPVAILFTIWSIVIVVDRPALDKTRRLFIGALFCGFLSYLVQGKGLPYQRYPFLAVGIVFIFLDCSRANRGLARVVALACLFVVPLAIVPKLTSETLSYDAVAPFQDSLGRTILTNMKEGSIQCLDTYGGCINVLYDLRVRQVTGYLYDCYLFTSPSAIRDRYREQFLKAFIEADPSVVIMTNDPCFVPARGFARLVTWPELDEEMMKNYSVRTVWASQISYRWWSRSEHPTSYMVYIHK
ncbi:MAG: hypothetical protein WCD70_03565 [Alphaproteobacteria bacterium]